MEAQIYEAIMNISFVVAVISATLGIILYKKLDIGNTKNHSLQEFTITRCEMEIHTEEDIWKRDI